MNPNDVFVFVFQILGLSVCIYGLYKYRLASYISILEILALWTTSILFALLSTYIATHGYEPDIRGYFADAQILLSYIENNFGRYIGVLFLTGGNSLYPDSYFPMLDASNTWPNVSFWTMTKCYTLFALLSRDTLYHIAIYFAFLSFLAKALWVVCIRKTEIDGVVRRVLILFLCIGATDIYFISGMYKESLSFFFWTVLVYMIWYGGDTIWKWFWILISVYILASLRIEFVIIAILSWGMIQFVRGYRQRNTLDKILSILSVCITSWIIYLSPLWRFFIKMRIDMAALVAGNNKIERYQSSDNWIDNVLDFVKHFLGVLYTPLQGAKADIWAMAILISNLISIVFLVYVMVRFDYKKKNYSQLIFLFIFLIGWMMIAYIVPNYIGQLRYRSLYFIIGILFFIFNSKTYRKNLYMKK